ncbi:hypothetical protein LJC23_05330 [Desulfovibrio sp. OttesenSCG-928-I05]|nr:hypothetical protein [Desulfovibrio sp. OttesenSCG-928-I05]
MSPFLSPDSFVRTRLAAVFFTAALLVSVSMGISGAHAAQPNEFPPEVQKAVNEILASRDTGKAIPSKAVLDEFLAYATSPLVRSGDFPAKRKEGHGIIWRSSIKQPMATTLRYLFDPKIPSEIAYPASVRRQNWHPGSDILTLDPPLWEQLGKHADTPLVLRGVETESITPDTFSSSFYSYTQDRLYILTEYQGTQVLITASWQKGKSDVGRKATPIGDYDNWDFVYSDAAGTLASGIGWADTYMYAANAIIVFYEEAPGSGVTRYTIFKWLDAGWSGMNMVKQEHLTAGAERSFAGLKAFLESPALPPAEEIAAYVASLEALDTDALRARFKPYSLKVSEAAANDKILQSDDFQKKIANGSYGDNLSREEIIAAMSVNWIKGKLGKPQLAGPLE